MVHRRLVSIVLLFSSLLILVLVSGCGGATPTPAAPAAAPTTAPAAAKPTEAPKPTTAPAAPTAAPAAAATTAPAAAASGAKKGGVLIVGQKGEPNGLDPAINTGGIDSDVYGFIYNGLVKFDVDMKITPDLAESWTIAPDQLSITFKLRKGIKFHNGREVTASDWVYTLERIRDPKTASPGMGQMSNIDKITAVDPNTLQITTKAPLGGLLYTLAFGAYWKVLPKEAVDANKDLQKAPMGTGPFTFKTWQPGVKIELVKNPDYFEKDAVNLDGITFQFIPDEASAIAALRSAKADFIRVDDVKNVSNLQKDTTIQYFQAPFIGYEFLSMNNRMPPFDNKQVRQAISYAIDREEVIAASLGGVGSLTGVLAPTMKPWTVLPSEFPSYKKDIAKAKQLMTAAGYNTTDKRIKTDLIVNKSAPTYVSDATVIQAQLKEIGIDINIVQEEAGTWLARVTQKKDPPLAIVSSGGYPHPDMVMYNAYHSKGGWNWSGVSDPDLDKLLEAAVAATDDAKKADLYRQAQIKLVNDDVPYVWLFVTDQAYATSKALKNFKPAGNKEIRHLAYVWLDK